MYNAIQIQGMSPENIFRQQAQDNTGHDGLHTPDQNRSDQYHQIYQYHSKYYYSDDPKFM